MKMKSYEIFNFLEVYEILEFKEGTIFRTKSTGKYIYRSDSNLINKSKYTTANPSASLLDHPEIEINVVCAKCFQ